MHGKKHKLLRDLDVCVGALGDLDRQAHGFNDGHIISDTQIALLHQLKAFPEKLRFYDLQSR